MDGPIFILGISSRSGTNFLYDLLRLHPAVDVADKVEEDFLLFGAHHLQEYVERVSSRWDMGWGMEETDSGELFRTLGQAGLEFLRRRQRNPGLRMLTKTPEVHNLPLFFDLFPDAKLVIVVRDGRAMVESKMTSFEVDFTNATKNWAAAANVILNFERDAPSPNFRIIKYENLYQDTHESVRFLLKFLELDAAVYPFDSIDALPVRGSSVFHGPSGKLDWKPVKKTEAFKPLERFAHWTPEQHSEFNFIAGDALERLGYELRETLYMKANIVITPHDSNSDLVTRLDNGAKALMPVDSVEILNGMNRFLSLRKHFYNSSLDLDERSKFLEFTRSCEENRLLQTSGEYLGSLRPSAEPEPAAQTPVTGVFIRTCDRPEFLQRILASLLASETIRELNIYVLDDSRDTGVREKNAAIVASAAEGRAAPVFYLGEQWQQAFIQRLSQVFPDYIGLIGYLLLPRPKGLFSAGRLLNIAMLAFAGQRLLTFDDDYIPDRAWQHQEASTDTLWITDSRAYCLQGYATEEELFDSCMALAEDPLKLHLDYLGNSIGEILNESGGILPEQTTTEDLGADTAARLNSQSRILTTGSGIIGRPISPDASQGWFASRATTVPVWANNKDYDAWMEGHHLFASFKQPSIMAVTFGMPVGIDNTVMTPPTLPVGKREDTLFAYLLHGMYYSSAHLEFPWAIAHKREPRDWRGATVDTPVGVCLAQVVMTTMQNTLYKGGAAGTAEARLMMAGSLLSEKSTLPDESLCSTVLSIYHNLSSSHRLKLMQLLESPYPINESMKDDIEKAIQVSKDAQLRQARLPRLDDTHCPADEPAQLAWLREELLLYGQSLLIWPSLWNHCRDNPEFVATEDARAPASSAIPMEAGG